MTRLLPFLAVLLTCSVSMSATAQKLIHGVVSDAELHAPLPAANIRIEGTTAGTITNGDGAYELLVDDLPATIVFRYIGFETQRVVVTQASPTRLDVALSPVTYEMQEVVVTDENPAIGIMECVLREKKRWRATLERYQAEAYTRFTLENDTGIVSIVESLSDVYWDHERGLREVIKSRRNTSNLELDEYLPAAQFVANFYDDNIEIAGYTFPGVTHPDAFAYYHFGLEGTRFLDDQLVYDITVRPRNRLKTAFSGTLAVLADECALLEVALEPGEAFLFPPPVEKLDITFFQQFSDFGGGVWLPVDFRTRMALRIKFNMLISFPTFQVRQVSRLTGYDVNITLPDTLFASEHVMVDSAAVEADTLLDGAGAVVPLDTAEVVAYAAIDSTMTLMKAFEPSGLLARYAKVEMNGDASDGNGTGSGGDDDGWASPVRLHYEPIIRYNRVEALHGGARASAGLGRIDVSAEAGYSTALHDADPWSYGGEVTLAIGPDRRGFAAVNYHSGVAVRYQTPLYPRVLTSAYELLGGDDYFDYYRLDRAAARVGLRLTSIGTTVTVGVQHEEPAPISTKTAFDLLGVRDAARPNPAVSPDPLTSASLTVGVGDPANMLGFTGHSGARAVLERGRLERAAGADAMFTRLTVAADLRVPTFFRRRLFPNALDLHVSAGTHWGTLPLQRFGIVDAGLGLYRPFGALRTLTGRPYEGAHLVAVHWEHNFRTVPFELLGAYGLARRGYSVILTGGHARTWLPDEYDSVGLSGSHGIHHELGLALSGLFSLLRLDVAVRLDAPGFTVGLAAARLF